MNQMTIYRGGEGRVIIHATLNFKREYSRESSMVKQWCRYFCDLSVALKPDISISKENLVLALLSLTNGALLILRGATVYYLFYDIKAKIHPRFILGRIRKQYEITFYPMSLPIYLNVIFTINWKNLSRLEEKKKYHLFRVVHTLDKTRDSPFNH